MKTKLAKKLLLNKETIASLNWQEAAKIYGGLVDNTQGTGCNTQCDYGCGGTGGGGGSGGTQLCSLPNCNWVWKTLKNCG